MVASLMSIPTSTIDDAINTLNSPSLKPFNVFSCASLDCFPVTTLYLILFAYNIGKCFIALSIFAVEIHFVSSSTAGATINILCPFCNSVLMLFQTSKHFPLRNSSLFTFNNSVLIGILS